MKFKHPETFNQYPVNILLAYKTELPILGKGRCHYNLYQFNKVDINQHINVKINVTTRGHTKKLSKKLVKDLKGFIHSNSDEYSKHGLKLGPMSIKLPPHSVKTGNY